MKKLTIKMKPKRSLDRLLIIDADLYLYQAVTDNLVERRTADDEYTYHLDVDQVQAMLEKRIEDDIRTLQAGGGAVLCFGSPTNWRTKLLPEYKAHRTKKKPLGYLATMAWMMTKWVSFRVAPLEADDLVGILATAPKELKTKTLSLSFPTERVIVSEDKDLNSVPGLHWNPRKPELGVYSVSQEEAVVNHMTQTLTGDTSDGYKGCPGVGEKSADTLLKMHKLNPWGGVSMEFKKAGLTVEDALTQARVARIMQHGDYDFATGEVRYWTPPGGSVAGRGGDRPRVVRRVVAKKR